MTKALRRGRPDRARGICSAKQANQVANVIEEVGPSKLWPSIANSFTFLHITALSIFICQD